MGTQNISFGQETARVVQPQRFGSAHFDGCSNWQTFAMMMAAENVAFRTCSEIRLLLNCYWTEYRLTKLLFCWATAASRSPNDITHPGCRPDRNNSKRA